MARLSRAIYRATCGLAILYGGVAIFYFMVGAYGHDAQRLSVNALLTGATWTLGKLASIVLSHNGNKLSRPNALLASAPLEGVDLERHPDVGRPVDL
jgi:hypothetical protein